MLHASVSSPFLRLFVALALSCLAWPARAADSLPSFEQVHAAYIASDAFLLDRHGEPLADMRLDPRGRRLPWVSLQNLSPAMREALIAAEDRRFFEHSGVDWKAFLGAAWQNLWGHRRGASTLTMQLAGLLDPALHLPEQGRERRSLTQKWDQSVAAIELEKRWTKPQILEAYINLAPFRGDLEGVGAASEILFGVTPQAITRREAVILAVLLRGPNARPALVTRRACALAEVVHDKKLCPQIAQLAQTRLDTPRNVPRYALAPHLARSLLRQPGQQVTSTLNAATQRSVLSVLAHAHMDAGVMAVDNASGEVLAWVGAANPTFPDGLLVRQTLAQWWAPHLAAFGIEQRSHTAASLLLDHNGSFNSLRMVLAKAQSGALRELVHEVGSEAFNEHLRQIGLDSLASDAAQSETSPAQIALAWRSLAANGDFLNARGLPLEASATHKTGSAASSFITQDLLADNFTGGWRSSWTSASADGHAQIVVGNTDKLTILIALTRPDKGELLARQAQQLWRDVAASLQTESSHALAVPEGVVSNIVVFEPPDEPPQRDWFIKGTEIDRVMVAAMPSGARLLVPRHGQRYILGNAGNGRQPWPLEALVAKAVRWQLDGSLIGQGPQIHWPPVLGSHRVQLLGPRDEVLDTAEFEVVPKP